MENNKVNINLTNYEPEWDVTADTHEYVHIDPKTGEIIERAFVPTTSTLKGLVWHHDFDSDDFQKALMKENHITMDEANELAAKIMKQSQDRGTCVHLQAEYAINHENYMFGCRCGNLAYPGIANSKYSSSHKYQYLNWKKQWVEHFIQRGVAYKRAELTYANKEKTLFGQQDILVKYNDGVTNNSDNKTTAEFHRVEECFQVVNYYFLRTGSLDIDTKKEIFSVINTNDGKKVWHDDEHRYEWLEPERRNGTYYEFSEEEVRNAISNNVIAINRWNELSLHDKIAKIRGNKAWGWTEQDIQNKMDELTAQGKDMKIALPENAQSLIIENSDIDPAGKDLTLKQFEELHNSNK